MVPVLLLAPKEPQKEEHGVVVVVVVVVRGACRRPYSASCGAIGRAAKAPKTKSGGCCCFLLAP